MNAISARETAPAIRPQSFMELERFATLAAKSDFVPKDYRGRPDNIMVAIQMGSELGLAPMQSLQNISVINGRPSVWGDAMLALCRRSPLCEDVKETSEGEGDALTAICLVRRRGASPVIVPFSVADAKMAGLWGKQGPWTQYPHRMLQMRARGFALRDAFPDLLRGLMSAEEAGDVPPGPTIEGDPEPTLQPAAKARQQAPEAKNNPSPIQTPEARQTDLGGNGDAPTASSWLDIYSRKLADTEDGPSFLTTYQDACATCSNDADLVRLHGMEIVAKVLNNPDVGDAFKKAMNRASSAAFKRLTAIQTAQDTLPPVQKPLDLGTDPWASEEPLKDAPITAEERLHA